MEDDGFAPKEKEKIDLLTKLIELENKERRAQWRGDDKKVSEIRKEVAFFEERRKAIFNNG